MREMIKRKEWLGDIPSKWGYIPGKYAFKLRTSKGNSTPVLLAATQKQGMYPQHLLEGVVQVQEGTDMQTFKTVHINDYVISLRSFQGGFEMSDYEGVCSPAYQVFYNTKPIDHRYFKYLFKCKGFIQEMDSVTVGIREGKNIPYNSFGQTYIPFPSLPEQSRIAAFLDERCGKIDEAIAKHKALIEKLDEYRRAVITKAVTKGVRGEREMKDTGLDWLGFIPYTWAFSKVKYECELHGRIGWNGLRSNEFEENSYSYLVTGQDFNGPEIDWKVCFQIRKERYEEDPYIQIHNGELLVTKDGTVGKVAIVSNLDKPACLNSGIFVVRQKRRSFVPKYLYWQFASPLLKSFNDYSNLGGTTIIHLYQKTFEQMPLIAPPKDEQAEIVAFLDKKCAAIDSAKDRHQQLIAKLEEYKKSLIYNAVTGKIEC